MASRSRKTRSGGSGGGRGFDKILWFLVVAGLIFAFFQVPYDPGVSGITNILKSKAETVQKWATGVGPAIAEGISDILKGGGGQPDVDAPGHTPYEPNKPGGDKTKDEVASLLNGLTIAGPEKVSYNRDEWNHWVNVRSCWTVREEVLARSATPGSLVLEDKNGVAVTDVSAACAVTGGEWADPYSGKVFNNPRDLDIDHMVPLKYTATHGGQVWDEARKESYANSLEPGHLLAVAAGENRSKSDKGPGDWKPSNKAYYCEYASNWVGVSKTWGLSVTEKDEKALTEMLSTCA